MEIVLGVDNIVFIAAEQVPLHVLLVVTLDDGPCSEEADARDHALDDPAQIRLAHACLLGNEDEHRGSQGDQHVRPHTRRLPLLLPLDPQRAARDRREQEAQDDAGDRGDAG